MWRFMVAVGMVAVLMGCSTLPGAPKEGQGVAILPLSFVNDSGLDDSLVDMELHFNHDKVPVTISPRNGYTVITTEYTDLQVTGIAFHPHGRASMAGGIGDVHPLSIDLATQPGYVSVAADGIEFVQGKRTEATTYSYFYNWYRISTGMVSRDKLRDQLKKDGNAKAWKFQDEAATTD